MGDLKGSDGLNLERKHKYAFSVIKSLNLTTQLVFFAYDKHFCLHISTGSTVSTVVQIVDLLKGS